MNRRFMDARTARGSIHRLQVVSVNLVSSVIIPIGSARARLPRCVDLGRDPFGDPSPK